MRIAICDDENEWINQIEEHIEKFKENHKNIVCEVFYSGEELLEYYKLYGNVFDVLITDIEMGGINGVELAKKIRKMDSEVPIFFLTSHDEYIRECFAPRPMNFWDKPVPYDIFKKDIEKVINSERKNNRYFSLKEDGIYKRIPYNDIIYFSNKGRKIVAHTVNGDCEFYGSFKDYSEIWKENNFYIVSRFFCVNTNYIEALKNNTLYLKGGQEITVSVTEIKKIKLLFFENDCSSVIERMKSM